MKLSIERDEVTPELDRLFRGLTGTDTHMFDSTLAAQFIATQAVVHVDTRSLKRSGEMDSKDSRIKWTGTIKYGGASPGSVHDPVDYARSEYNRPGVCPGGRHQHNEGWEPCPGGPHDFLAPAKDTDGSYGVAVEHFLKGGSHGNAR